MADIPAEGTSPMEEFSGDMEESVSEDEPYEDTPEDPDDLPPLSPPMPPPVPSSPELKEPIIIDLNDHEPSNFLPNTPLISESPLKSLTSFLPSFLRPGTPPNESSTPDESPSQNVELHLESNGLENELENSSEMNHEEQLNEENNVDTYYEEDVEAYLEDNGYEPEYIPDSPEPDVDNLDVSHGAFTRSKSVTFADDIESSENLEDKSSIPLFSIFGSIHRRLSDTLKPLLSPKEADEPTDLSENIEDEGMLETSSATEDDEWQNHHHVLNEEEIEIHETEIDSSEVPMIPEMEELLPESEEVPPEVEEVSPELEEALENNNQVDLETNNVETLDIYSSGVEPLGEPSETVNTDESGEVEGDDTMVSEAKENLEPSPLTGSIPFSLGAFSSFRMPGSNEVNNNDEVKEGQEPTNERFSFGGFSKFRISGSNSTNETPSSEVNDGQEPPPENTPFSFGGFSKFKIPGTNSTNDPTAEVNDGQEPPPENAAFSFGSFSKFRMPGSNSTNETSEANEGQEPPVENAPFSFGISGFRDLVPVIPLPAFPNSDMLDEDVEAETERVSDGQDESVAIPEVSIQEIPDADTEPSTAPLVAGGFLTSDRFGQDDDVENIEAHDKEDGEIAKVDDQPLEQQLHTSDPLTDDHLGDVPLPVTDDHEVDVSTTDPMDQTEIPPPLETEIPAEITAETPPLIEPPQTVNEEKVFKKQTSSSDVPKRYAKGDLMKGSSSSLTSLYSASGEAYGKIPITGDVQFGLSYNHKLTQFSISVVACRDLAPVDTKKNKSDPYVKVYLLPDKGRNGKRKTKIRKGTINPQFNELLRYKIKETELRTRTLSVAVWNNDKLGRNFFLGEVLLPLDDIQFDNYNAKWHQLLPKVLDDGGIIYKGDITLALKFEGEGVEADQKQPKSTGALMIHFKSAKNLTAVRLNGSDPYAKCYLEPDRTKAGKRKTKHIRSNCNPTWDQQVQYDDVTVDDLKQRALHVTVWDRDTLSANDFLGVICLSLGTGRVGGKEVNYMKSKGEEIRIWEEMLAKPNTWIEATIPLQAKV